MRWFFSTQKSTRRLLVSRQYRLHGGSGSHFFHTVSNSKGRSRSIELPSYRYSSPLFSAHHYATSTILNDTQSSYRVDRSKVEKDTNKVDREIISVETIKPSSPTPHHLRTFSLSIIDQFMFDFYNPLIIFLPNDDKASVTHVITKRLKHLKENLSDILTLYYPFAGEIKDNLYIECNDKGVDFAEVRVNQSLQDFLRQPEDEEVRELIPKTESSSKIQVASFQVNIFDCGGIALSSNLSHKIVDGHTYFLFIKAWAAAVRGSPEKIAPSFVASKLFPNNPSLKYSLPSEVTTPKVLRTKRFVFDVKALATLKVQPTITTTSLESASHSHGATRTETTGALIWKVAAKAASTLRAFSPQSPHVLFSAVNIRKRALPPLPKESIGNLSIPAIGICFPKSQPSLPTLMGEMRESIAKINSDLIEAMRGEKGHQAWNESLKGINDLFHTVSEEDYLVVTSLLNNEVHKIDFGWGKPIWFYYVNPGTTRVATLTDTIKGGVEAFVSLSPEEMEIFERDPEILSYTTIDTSPLLLVS